MRYVSVKVEHTGNVGGYGDPRRRTCDLVLESCATATSPRKRRAPSLGCRRREQGFVVIRTAGPLGLGEP
jgi:hypothetical protein